MASQAEAIDLPVALGSTSVGRSRSATLAFHGWPLARQRMQWVVQGCRGWPHGWCDLPAGISMMDLWERMVVFGQYCRAGASWLECSLSDDGRAG